MEKEYKLKVTRIPENYDDLEGLRQRLEFVINQHLYGNPCVKGAFLEEIKPKGAVVDDPELLSQLLG